MSDIYVGIYWTLPVNWAEFRHLPPSVEAAAASSRTIRYQRERVRRHLVENSGRLVDEIAFMDTRPDRATDAVRDVLQRHAPLLQANHPTLVTVGFDRFHRWRPNPFLAQAANEIGLTLHVLEPDALVIDNQVFDPARHFKAWRKRDESAMARLRLAAAEGFAAAMSETPVGRGRWKTVADLLNERGIRTIRGGRWTSENVRKLVDRIGLER